jgi:TamB, inner membrane protein subunit of TAM complex
LSKDIETIQGLEKEELPELPKKKKSIGRTIWRWFRGTVLIIFFIVVSALVALQLPIVQTWLAKQLSGYLKNKYDLEVSIAKVNINLFRKTVSLSEVMVGDHHKDTIIHAGIVKVDIGNIHPSQGYIEAKRVVLEDGYINIRTYKGENVPNITQFINTLKGKQQKAKKKKGKAWLINMETVVLDECNLRIRNENQNVLNADFLPSDIRVQGIAGKVGNFEIKGDTLEMDIDNLRAFEASGLAMKKFSSHVVISSKELTFKAFKLSTYKSSLAGYFSMRYSNWKSFSQFNDSIYMIADLEMSDINASDLAFFTNNLKGIDFDFRFKGGLAGTLSHLKSDEFAIYFGSISQMVGDIELIGLPNIDSTYFSFKVKKLTTDALDLERIPIPPFGKKQKVIVPKEIERLGVIKYRGNLKGTFSDIYIDGFATTKLGNADMDMHLYKATKTADYQYNGTVDAQQFNIGKLLAVKEFGTITFDGHLDGKGFDFKKGNSYANFKGNVKQLEFYGYNYKNINANAKFSNSMFEGIVDIKDTNAQINFIGSVDLKNGKKPIYDFTADIHRADLVALNFVKTKESSIISTALTVKMEGGTIDDLVGQVRICGTDYTQGSKTFHMETFVLNSFIEDTTKTLDIHSDILNARFSGQFKFIPLMNEIKRQINHVAPSLNLKPNDKIKYTPQNFYFYIVLSHPELLTEIFMPDLKISDGSVIDGRLGSANNYLSIEINIDKIKYKKMVINEWYFYARNKNEKLRIQSDAKSFFLSDSTKVDNVNMSATARNDSLDLWLGFQNEVANLNGASINVLTYFGNAPKYEFNIHDSYFYFNDSLWVVNNDNSITLEKSDLSINNLNINTSGNKKKILSINGKSSESNTDKITATLDNFPLELVNAFLPGDKLKLNGAILGEVDLYRILQKPFFTSRLAITNVKVNEMLLGRLGIYSTYDPEAEEINLKTYLIDNGKTIVKIENGKIKLKNMEDGFDIKANIDGLDLSVLEKMAYPVFTNLKGMAYGSFELGGTFAEPTIHSQLNLQKAGLRLDYLNAYFNFEMGTKEIIINNDMIRIPQLDLTDKYGNTGTVKGKISHNLFKDIFLDIKLETKNMCVMETTEKNNEQFYGKAFATGKATIIGEISDIIVVANMTTEKNTVLNIPIKSSKSIRQNNFVEFINPNDTVIETVVVEEEKGNFTLDLNVKATPDATIRIIFDETVGDVITCQGYSDQINLNLNTRGKFTMLGTYEITKGDYLFTLQNIINKKFTVKSGSSISFTGNPYYAQVNATAIYRANASVYPIISSFMDPSSAELYRKATRVDCELTLTNTLSDLLLGFSLQLPSLDANAASLVKSTLNTQEEMNRQVFSLLVLNQFLPPESTGGGAAASSSMVGSGFGNTSLELLSGQLNNWLSKITKDVNINLNYKTGSQTSSDQVSVALSTQLFNERVIIDGDVGVGVGAPKATQTSNQIVGNVSVEVKVTNDGRLRIRAFNRSNDYNPLKNSVDYTQGMGISYKVEFDSWGDLFKSKKPKKKKEKKKKDLNNVEKNDSLKTN